MARSTTSTTPTVETGVIFAALDVCTPWICLSEVQPLAADLLPSAY